MIHKMKNIPFATKIPWFAVLGGFNLAAYALSTQMSEEDYVHMMAYKGEGKYMDMFKGMIASNKIGNAVMTSSILIGCGVFMHNKVGYLTMLKFLPLALAGNATFWMAFNPNPQNAFIPNFSLIKGLFPGF